MQACIDEVRDSGVTVIATVNDIDKLPGSLVRTGRFDRRILVSRPAEDKAEAIITHYLSDKPVDSSVNADRNGRPPKGSPEAPVRDHRGGQRPVG